MGDTRVVVPPRGREGSAVGFAKNSDRAPGEAQVTEHPPRARHVLGTEGSAQATGKRPEAERRSAAVAGFERSSCFS